MKAKMTANRQFTKGTVDPRIFSGFIEHLGRAVYTGIYEPEHPTADADGFRSDVIDLVKALDMPLTRYPGGNFVSGYDWKDGIGDPAKRPARLDLAWTALEPNQFGLDEFMKWCVKVNTAPIMAVNLGTGTPKDAGELVEYCNFAGNSYWSDLRKANGHSEPYRIKTWCLGNEMDGHWQTGAKTAEEYGRIAVEAAKIMKWIDPEIELVACGSSSLGMPGFAAWDATVLEHTFDQVDYLSLHAYYGDQNKNLPEFLAAPDKMSAQIEAIIATCDYVSARKKSDKKINLSFDEYNVWFHSFGEEANSPRWTAARPILEDIYTLADALVVGGLLITLLQHADRVKIACLAQTVNVIAPIMTRPGGGAWKQTIYYPFYYTSRYGRGEILDLRGEVPEYTCANWTKPVKTLHSVAVWHKAENEIALFVLNREVKSPVTFEYDLQGFDLQAVVEAVEISGADPAAVNTEAGEKVFPKPRAAAEFAIAGATVSGVLPPLSWTMIRIKVKS